MVKLPAPTVEEIHITLKGSKVNDGGVRVTYGHEVKMQGEQCYIHDITHLN
jgi:hypothetical protein